MQDHVLVVARIYFGYISVHLQLCIYSRGTGPVEIFSLHPRPLFSLQEIPLSEILSLEPAQTFSLLPDGANIHCFEIATASLVYYVGENLQRADSSVTGSSILVNNMMLCA